MGRIRNCDARGAARTFHSDMWQWQPLPAWCFIILGRKLTYSPCLCVEAHRGRGPCRGRGRGTQAGLEHEVGPAAWGRGRHGMAHESADGGTGRMGVHGMLMQAGACSRMAAQLRTARVGAFPLGQAAEALGGAGQANGCMQTATTPGSACKAGQARPAWGGWAGRRDHPLMTAAAARAAARRQCWLCCGHRPQAAAWRRMCMCMHARAPLTCGRRP